MAANVDFSISRSELVTDVLETLGALEEGQSPSAAQTTSLSRTLNMLLKHWQGAMGVNLFAVRETFLFLQDGVYKYDQLDYNGTTGLDVDRNHIYVSAYEKVAFTDITTGATTVEVAESFVSGNPVASAVATDVVGIPLEDGTVHWAEITAVGTSGSYSKSFDFTGHALPSAADATKDMIVGITYPGRPIRLVAASLRHIFDDTERTIDVISTTDYNSLSNKALSSSVNQVYYNREVATGDLRTWGAVDGDNYVLVLWAQVPLTDMDSDLSLTTTGGIPQEYYMAITYSLAEALIPKYAVPTEVARDIRRLAEMYRTEALSYDTEESIRFTPNMQGR